MTEEIKLRSNRKNLTGQKFGKLTVIKPVKTINDTSRWLCKCECGNEKVVATYRLLSGRVKTCGDCFNTINFYIPIIKRLEQERDELKKACEKCKLFDIEKTNRDLLERIDKLKQENKELKEKAPMKLIAKNNAYRSALEEIRETAEQCYDATDKENDTLYTIYEKINEVLNDK